MIDQPTIPHRHYDPLLDERPRRKKLSTGAMVGIAISVVVHAGLFYYIWKVKFEPHYDVQPQDPGVVATIFHPVTLTPLQPPPKTVQRTPPPQLAPRVTPTQTIPTDVLPFVSTTEKPVESTLPPTVADTPPPKDPPVTQTVQPKAPPVITNPDWVRQPNGDDLIQYYPERAQRLEKSGSASIQCAVTTSGSLSACHVLSETPEGLGFGEATLKVSHLFRMKPAMQGGHAVEGSIVIPLRWQLK